MLSSQSSVTPAAVECDTDCIMVGDRGDIPLQEAYEPEPDPEPQEAEDLGESTFVIVDEQDAVEPEDEEEVAGEVAEKPAAWFPSFFYYDADAVADTDDAAADH